MIHVARFEWYLFLPDLTIWAVIWQNQQNECAPREDSDQHGHPPSLIRVFAVHMKKPWVLSYPLRAQRRLRSDWADAQADLSLRLAHSHFVGFVMRRLNCDCVEGFNDFWAMCVLFFDIYINLLTFSSGRRCSYIQEETIHPNERRKKTTSPSVTITVFQDDTCSVFGRSDCNSYFFQSSW